MQTRRDFRRVPLAVVLALISAACGVGPVPPVERYSLDGVVQSLDAANHTATIKHHEIKGFMDAMTMEFPVKDRQEFATLRKGEAITATVFVQDTTFWIGEIKEKP